MYRPLALGHLDLEMRVMKGISCGPNKVKEWKPTVSTIPGKDRTWPSFLEGLTYHIEPVQLWPYAGCTNAFL